MPPIIYTSERYDPKKKEVHTQQPTNDVNLFSQNMQLGPGIDSIDR